METLNPFADKGFVRVGNVISKAPGFMRGIQDGHPASAVRIEAKFDIKPSTDEQKLNKLERTYLAYLRRLNPPHIGIQNITLKLGDDLRYTPDFSTIDENGRFVFHETKGPFYADDARVKLLAAARQFRMFTFLLVKQTKGLTWQIEEVAP